MGNKGGKLKRWAFLSVFLVVIFFGCVPTYNVQTSGGNKGLKLQRNDPVYIRVPHDGKYRNKTYPGSGWKVATVINRVFSKFASRVSVGRYNESLEDALENANKTNAKILISPKILHWEDRATAWSGRADRLNLRIEILEVATKSSLITVFIEGTSGTFIMDDPSPSDLIEKPILNFAESIY